MMRKDAFAFFRGNCRRFAMLWECLEPPAPGPIVLCCGDLHVDNFGLYRAADGAFFYDVNDFDEAFVAPCGIDVVRCTTSLVLAAQAWKLSPIAANGLVLCSLTA